MTPSPSTAQEWGRALRRIKLLQTFSHIKKRESKRGACHRVCCSPWPGPRASPARATAWPHTDGSKPRPRAQTGPAPGEETELCCQRPKLEQTSIGKWPLMSQGGDSKAGNRPSRRAQPGGGSRTPGSGLEQPLQHLPVLRSLRKARRIWAHPATSRIHTRERVSLGKGETGELLRRKAQG